MTRQTLLDAVRNNYASIAKASSQTINYPGKWLYAHWSDSDLKDYLDRRGIEVPQPYTRDKLISHVRRASHAGTMEAKGKASDASVAAKHAQQRVSDDMFNAWSETELKNLLDKHGIRVPQGSKRNELIALARRHRHLWGASVERASQQAKQTTASKLGYPHEHHGFLSTISGYYRPAAGWFWSQIKSGGSALYGRFSSVAHNDTEATKRAEKAMRVEL